MNSEAITAPEQRPRNRSTKCDPEEKWWKIHLFRGIVNDIKRRFPFYWSDWLDAWDYRVVPATVYMYFAKPLAADFNSILPALAFSLDMFTKTNMSFGVNEVLLSSVLASIIFAIFAAQPLVIVGVTGPITVFNYTVYDIITPHGIDFFIFMALVGFSRWSMILHWILAITNACNHMRYVTQFSCDIFGFYVAFIYLQKGIQVLTRQDGKEPFYLSILIALLVLVVGYLCGLVGFSHLFQHYVRVLIKDYGTPITLVFFTGFVHIGNLQNISLQTLPISKSFTPSKDRDWLVPFWNLNYSDVLLALPFAILLTILFYFDHNVSSLMAQGTEFPLRKPAGFHWDLFLLGLTTGIAGIIGVPYPNGLIPQAPFHTESLCVRHAAQGLKGNDKVKVSRVVEQRVSNLAQGLLTLVTMTGPFLLILHLIPQGVLAGLFFLMDKSFIHSSEPLQHIRRSALWAFVAIQIFGFGATFAITQTIAAVGFPVIILLLIPVRVCLLPKWFTEDELRALDGPAASPFTMISVGGIHGTSSSHIVGDENINEKKVAQSQYGGIQVGYDNSDVLDEARAQLQIAPDQVLSSDDMMSSRP
ncbi:putative boron transporter 1 [Blumeria hordei DH14]|uniref:Putative boron transporter 1 n=1 Tax=Blumeria graminis f. sp. hordei (strain DH14) TaxID=546991 RepID=N1JFS0_BLUG1|nr:putative boron transporter 1 [Blumeria hordei DH14]